MNDPIASQAGSADGPSRWDDDPCRDTPIAVVLVGIVVAVLGPLAVALFLAV